MNQNKNENGFFTEKIDWNDYSIKSENFLKPVYRNGKILLDKSFDEVKANIT